MRTATIQAEHTSLAMIAMTQMKDKMILYCSVNVLSTPGIKIKYVYALSPTNTSMELLVSAMRDMNGMARNARAVHILASGVMLMGCAWSVRMVT